MADSEGVVAPGNQFGKSGVTSGRWQQVEALFEQTLEAPASERPQFLQAIRDLDLRREVESLLQAHQEAGAFIDEPDRFFSRESFEPDTLAPGQVIDRYRVIHEIGRGGMGAVFLAERADDVYRKQVAIKLIKRGMDTESVLRRFYHERQILASLEHPNIARLLDGGTTQDGLPYFVMEYIDGQRIDRYADEGHLTIKERLALFRQVCGAVSYAHQQLIVHRDLKPSNILVTTEGTPKLLDFGIAKIIQANEETESFSTMTAAPVMTPEFASPEQLEGAHATTLSDVYSLGAVLYELLSGRPPHESKSGSPQEIAKAIETRQTEKPSAVVKRAEDARHLRGDLDNIVLMALRKEPERRYQSVEQFSEDLRRHLEERPVLARKDTVTYRAAKFARRNKAGLAAAALVLLSLVGGIVVTTRQAKIALREKARAERRFNEVRKLAKSVLFDYHDAIKALPGATNVRELLVKDALNYLDSLAGEAQGDPELQRELAAAYERVGDVRGGELSGSRGDLSGAIESYTKALKICEALVAANPADVKARRALASSHQKIGWRLRGGTQSNAGFDHLQKALALYLDLEREQSADHDLQLELADTRNKLGYAMSNRSDFAGALAQHRSALAICEKIAASDPHDQKALRGLLSSQEKMAFALRFQGDVAGAIEANHKELALSEALLAEDPLNTDYRRSLVLSYQHGGDFLAETDKRGALNLFQKAATADQEMLAADPANALARKDLAYTHKKIADLLVDLEDHDQALGHFRQALETYQKLVADAPTDIISQFLVATCEGGLARMRARLGDVQPALEECQKAQAVLQQITADKTAHIGRAQACDYLGKAYVDLAACPKLTPMESREHTTSAREMFRKALDVLDDIRKRQGTLGGNEVWAKQIAEAIATCDAALAR